MLNSLLAGLLEEWEELEEQAVPVETAEPEPLALETAKSDIGVLEPPADTPEVETAGLETTVPSADPDELLLQAREVEPSHTSLAAERAAARREGILRLLAAMYPEAASRITERSGAAVPVAPRRPASEGYVVFHLAGESFAMGLSQVVEADRVPEITPVPFVPEFVRGVTNRRGEVLPLIDLRLLLGLDPSLNAGDGRMLVVRRSESDPPAALIVDGLGGIAWFNRLHGVRLSSQVAGRFPELLRGSGQHRDSTVHVMDVERLLARKELEDLTAA